MATFPQICGTGFSCGLDATLHIISGKWKPLALFFLRDGPKRYGELKRSIGGVSDKVLIQQLKELERDEIIARIDYKEIPPKVEYSLTPFGRSLAQALGPLCQWGTDHMLAVERISERRTTALAQP